VEDHDQAAPRHAGSLSERGETIIITRRGRPVARLCPIAPDTERLSPEKAFSLLLAMDRPLGTDLRSLIVEGRRG
jgi:antitoxin (DNA-binding transcriptional repressor) of toxin-antitoxin stability system